MSCSQLGKQEPEVGHDTAIKENHGDNRSEDLISQLPEHILLLIISSLTLKEEAIVCATSKRWWSLWPHIPAMKFELPPETKYKVRRSLSLVPKERSTYINKVNQVLNSQRGSTSTIDQFSIDFEFDSSFTNEIDRWLDFAFARRVQKLKLCLTIYVEVRPEDYSLLYTFPEHLYQHLKTPAGLSSIKNLSSLYLRSVNVSGEILGHFLSNCPALEQLVVDSSNLLVSLKVVGPLPLRLKHLEILRCPNFTSVELCVPNLVYFGYNGAEMKMCIGDTPFLAYVSICDWDRKRPGSVLSQLSGCFPQLETLDLTFFLSDMEFPAKAELTYLKQLTVTSFHSRDLSLLGLDSLMKGAPLLEKLTVKLFASASFSRNRKSFKGHKKEPDNVKTTHRYPRLKIVEMYDFKGHGIELELAFFLLEKATMLEKLVIDPYPYGWSPKYRELGYSQEVTKLINAKLKDKVPPKAELIIPYNS